MDGRVERRTLSVIFHQKEVIRSTTFDLLLADRVPLIRCVVLDARVCQLGGVGNFILYQAACFGFERCRLLVGLFDFDELAADAMHCIVLRHANMPLALVVARARHNHRLRHEALLRCAKRLHCCRPGLAPTDSRGSVCLIFLRPWQVLNAKDVLRSSRQECGRVCTVRRYRS